VERTFGERAVNCVAVALPQLVAVVAVWGVFDVLPSFGLVLFALFHFLAFTLGAALGYHRMLAHAAFEPHPALKALLLMLGAFAVTAPPVTFVAQHLAHHRDPETEADPHSAARGFWHSHVGWILSKRKLSVAPSRRMADDAMANWFERYHAGFAILGLVLPALVGGALGPVWYGQVAQFSLENALEGLLWGGFVRLAFGHHSVFAAASLSHLWGSRTFSTEDTSRNSPLLLNLLQLGDGYHNHHHAIPRSATFATRRDQVDVVAWIIKVFERAGLARRVVWPRVEDWARVETKLAQRGKIVRSARR
jgi:stearoyl-CoA desaturase (delta-9 desaturase)